MFIPLPHRANINNFKPLHLLSAVLLLLLITTTPAYCVDVTLTVLDAQTEEPVSGATVSTQLFNENLEQTDDEFITDTDGLCYFSVFPERPLHFTISVEADGYLTQIAYWTNSTNYPDPEKEGAVPEEYTIRLYKPNTTIGGIVKDENGYPVENAKVFVNPSLTKGRESTKLAEFETYTDHEGKWICEKIYSEVTTFGIKISHPEYGTENAYIRENNSDDIEALRNQTYHTILYKGIMVTGLVRDAAGNPIEGAEVAYSFEGKSYSFPRPSVKTDHDGFYSISGAIEGGMYLIAKADGYTHELRKFNLTLENTEQNFTLQSGMTLKGIVVDQDDNPIKGAFVSMEDIKEMSQVFLAFIQTDDSGRFEWNSSPAGGAKVDISAQGYIAKHNLELMPKPSDHIIKLSNNLVISGVIYNSDTRELIKEFKIIPGGKYSDGGEIYWDIRMAREIKDKDGKYKFHFSYPRHEFHLRAEAEGYEASEAGPFKAEDGDVTCDFALKKSDRKTRDFTGTIQEKYTNKPLAGVKVILYDTSLNKNTYINWQTFGEGQYRKETTETDDDGRFSFDKVSFDSAMMTIEKEGYARHFVKDVDLSVPFFSALPKGASISGYLYNDLGKPKARDYIFIALNKDYEEGMETISTDQKGFFKIKGLPAGKYRCMTISNGQQDKVHIAIVSEGKDYVVDWEAPGIATLEGIYMTGNLPVADMIVSAYSQDEKMPAAGCRTKADGTYRLNLPFLGRHSISFYKGDPMDPDHIFKNREIDIKPGLNRLDMISGSNISGRAVFAKDEEPAANAKFFAFKKENHTDYHKLPWGAVHTEPYWKQSGQFSSNVNGEFKVKETSPGEWLIAYREGGEEWMPEIIIPSKTVTLKDMEDEKNVLFRIPETTMLRLNIVDKDTGDILKDFPVCCRNQDGFIFQPYRKKVLIEGENQPKWELNYDENKRLLFRKLPPGKYTLFSQYHQDYPISSIDFEIPEPENLKKTEKEPEETFVDLTFELEKGGRIVFKLPKDYMPKDDHFIFLGYYLADTETEQPVLKTEYGPTWGGQLRISKEQNDKLILSLKPGKYILQAVLREVPRYRAADGVPDLWTYTTTATVEKGKDVEINIEMENKDIGIK